MDNTVGSIHFQGVRTHVARQCPFQILVPAKYIQFTKLDLTAFTYFLLQNLKMWTTFWNMFWDNNFNCVALIYNMILLVLLYCTRVRAVGIMPKFAIYLVEINITQLQSMNEWIVANQWRVLIFNFDIHVRTTCVVGHWQFGKEFAVCIMMNKSARCVWCWDVEFE